MFRRSQQLLRAAVVTATAAVAACGLEGSDVVEVSVQPRVVLDGTVELADRTAGRVIIDEVIVHAASARLRAAVAGDTGDVVADAADPLLFHYVLADRTGFAAALGGDRTWSMPASGAALAVLFGAAPDSSDALFDDADPVLDGLAGHTAIIHGTIAIETNTRGTFSAFGGFNDVDPDGTPAKPVDDRKDTDPDGAPASPESDVDPDGTPADVDPDGTPADVDPDGGPAVPGRPGTSDIDPDGGTARTSSSKSQHRSQGLRRSVVQVPFSLVVDGGFEREVLLTSEAIAGVGCGEVMPIDLHMSAAELFDSQRLTDLEQIAKDAVASDDDDASVLLHVSGSQTAAASTVSVPGSIRRPTRVTDSSSRIRVSSDVRR